MDLKEIHNGTSIVYNEPDYQTDEELPGSGDFCVIEVREVTNDQVTIGAYRCENTGPAKYHVTNEMCTTEWGREEAIDVMSIDDTLYEVERTNDETFEMVL